MGFKEKSAFCASCNRQVLVRRETPNHVLHFLITALTCGLWGIVWAIIILSESGKPWRCTNCGSPTTHQSLSEYSTASLPQESSGMFGQLSTSNGLSTGKIIAFGFLGLVGLIVVISIISAVVNPPRDSKSASNQANPTSTPSVSTVNKNSADYRAGYKKGFQEGKSWAKEVESDGIPYPIAIRAMAEHQSKEAKAKDASAWQSGWEDGFVNGHRLIKPSKIILT